MNGFFYHDVSIPYVTVEEMKKIDDLMINKYQIKLVQMRENIGFALASLAYDCIKNKLHKKIVILTGKGNNGGGGLEAARCLSNWGATVTIINLKGEIKMFQLYRWKVPNS